MLRKRADRRAAKHRHQDDIVFESGHAIYTDELRLHRSGIRGRKSVVLAIAFGIVFVLAIGNLVITAMLISVLRMTPEGVPSLHIGSEGLLAFRKRTEFGTVFVNKFLGSFKGDNLSVESNHELGMSVGMGNESSRSKFVVRPNQVSVEPLGTFRVISKNGSESFNTESITLNDQTKKLVMKGHQDTVIQARKISHENLKLESSNIASLNAGANLLIKSSEVNVDASAIDIVTQVQLEVRLY
jgi:beta-sarcoglycan